jgi:hypothetical protein
MEPEFLGTVSTTLDMDLKTPEPADLSKCVDSKLRLNAASGARLDVHSNGLTVLADCDHAPCIKYFNQTGGIG